MEDPFQMGEYDPYDPESEPNRELKDHIAEPVDLWVLEHGAVTADTFRKAREVWTELGEPTEVEAPIDAPDAWDPDHIRMVTPAQVNEYAGELKPNVFESLQLHKIPSTALAALSDSHMIAGQIIGVPVQDGYCPTLLLTVGKDTDPADLADSILQTIHIANDVFGDDPEDMQVIF